MIAHRVGRTSLPSKLSLLPWSVQAVVLHVVLLGSRTVMSVMHLAPAMRINGVVSSGLGRAHIFMSQPHYQEQFKSIIGRSAWPGY